MSKHIADEIRSAKEKQEKLTKRIGEQRRTQRDLKKQIFDVESGEKKGIITKSADPKNELKPVKKNKHKSLEEIATSVFWSAFTELSAASAEVNVEYKGTSVRLHVDSMTKFKDLSSHASSYFSFPPKSIMFSDVNPNEHRSPSLYLPESLVIQEIYIWGNLRPSSYVFNLYILVQGSEDYDRISNNFSDITNLKELDEVDQKESVLSLEIVSKIDQFENRIHTRMNSNFLYEMAEGALFVLLVLLWLFSLFYELNVANTSSFNSIVTTVMLESDAHLNVKSIDRTTILKSSDENEFWEDLKRMDVLILSNNIPLIHTIPKLNEFHYLEQYTELRQVRSKMHYCEHDELGTHPCLSKYSTDESTSDYGPGGAGFSHETPDQNDWLVGIIDIYALEGFRIDFSVFDFTERESLLNKMKNNNWIDDQTRGVFFTWNFIDPHIGTYSAIVFILEITPEGVYIPNFKIYTLTYSRINTKFIVFHCLTLLLIIVLLYLQIRKLTLTSKEVECIALKKKRGKFIISREMIEEWEQKRSCHRSLRVPTLSEVFNLSQLSLAFCLELVLFSWYFIIFKAISISNTEYNNLVPVALRAQIITDFRILVILLFSITLVSLIYSWLNFFNKYYDLITRTLELAYQLVLLFFSCILVSTLILFNFIGIYSYEYTRFDFSFLNTLKIALGNVSIEDIESLNKYNLTVFILFLRFTIFITILLYASVISFNLAKLSNKK